MGRDYTNNSNHALIFANTQREKEKDPQWKGHGEISCPHCGKVGRFWLSAWNKTSTKAGNFISMAFRPKDFRMSRDEQVPWDN